MSPRQLVAPVVAVVVALAVYLAWPKQKVSPEDEIRALVTRVIARAEKRDLGGVTEAFAEGFRGGGLGKQEVKQLLAGQIFGARQLVVLNPLLEVTVTSPTQGRLKGQFLFGRDAALPDATRYSIEADLVKGSDGWQFVTATWTH